MESGKEIVRNLLCSKSIDQSGAYLWLPWHEAMRGISTFPLERDSCPWQIALFCGAIKLFRITKEFIFCTRSIEMTT